MTLVLREGAQERQNGGNMEVGFIVFVIMGLFFVGMGIYCFFAKEARPMGFWANAKPLPMKDVKGYNRAMGKLWCVFGVVFIILGLPLLAGQNYGLIVISIIGIMFEAIGAMVVYTRIEAKYKK